MNQPKTEQEPSMEEILASIRRIISEDGDDGEAGEAEPPAATLREVTQMEVDESDEGNESDEGVEGDEDVLELTEIVADEPEPEIEAEPEVEPEPERRDVSESEDDSAIELESPIDPPEMEDSLVQPAVDDENLVSDSATLMASAALSRLKEKPVSQDSPSALGVGDKTLEAIARELLRPMMKEWLDQNLPAIVERIVEREITRVAQKIQEG